MSAEKLSLATQRGSEHTTLVRAQLLTSLHDPEYRHEFVQERVHSSVALQIRALRTQRNNMTQKTLGEAIGMAQTWISKLEDPEYGKMTVATLLRLAKAFDADLEIKFRPFSKLLDCLPVQGPEYFTVPSFEEEFGMDSLAAEDIAKVLAIDERRPKAPTQQDDGAKSRIGTPSDLAKRLSEESASPPRKSTMMSVSTIQEQYGYRQGTAS